MKFVDVKGGIFLAFSIMSKIKNVKLRNCINSIIENVKDFHDNPFLYSFTDHGIKHSTRMLDCINSLLEGCQQKSLLNEYECYVLIAAIYLHDIGIQESKVEVLTKFARAYNIPFDSTINIPEFVRNNHHFISAYLIKEDISGKSEPLVYVGDVELGYYIALVVESHGIDFSEKDDIYRTYIYHDKSIDIKLLSVLLCLADAFDCDNRRIDQKKFKYVELPKISRIHWIKHLYVKGIIFKNRIITISYSFPVLGENEQEMYKIFFCNETECWIEYMKNKYLSILNDVNLVFQVKREVSYVPYIEKLDMEDYSYVEETVFDNIIKNKENLKYRIVSIGVLLHNKKVLMVRRKNPERSLSASEPTAILEWQFPAGIVKTIDTLHYSQVSGHNL